MAKRDQTSVARTRRRARRTRRAFTLTFGLSALVAGLGIVALRGAKHDLFPVVAAALEDPTGAARRVWNRL